MDLGLGFRVGSTQSRAAPHLEVPHACLAVAPGFEAQPCKIFLNRRRSFEKKGCVGAHVGLGRENRTGLYDPLIWCDKSHF